MVANDVKFSVKMLASYMNMSVEKLAIESGIDPYHLQQVSCGRVRMTGKDLVRLSEFTGISANKIEA